MTRVTRALGWLALLGIGVAGGGCGERIDPALRAEVEAVVAGAPARDWSRKGWDPAAAHNARFADVAPSERAWPALARAHALVTRTGVPEAVRVAVNNTPVDEIDWVTLEAWLERAEVREAVGLLLDASSLETLGVRASDATDGVLWEAFGELGLDRSELVDPAAATENPDMVSWRSEASGAMRSATRTLVASGLRAQRSGDSGSAHAISVARLARMQRSQGLDLLTSRLMGTVMGVSAARLVPGVIEHGSPEEIAAVLAAFDAVAEELLVPRYAASSRVFVEDYLRRVTDDRGHVTTRSMGSSGIEGSDQLSTPVDVDLTASKQWNIAGDAMAVIEHALGEVEQAEREPWRAGMYRGTNGLEAMLGVLEGNGQVLVLPALAHIDRRVLGGLVEARCIVDGHRVALAAALVRAETGGWPAALDGVVGRMRGPLPIDAMTGESLVYRNGPDGPIVYSRGMDGDDDRGAQGPRLFWITPAEFGVRS
ncbi:MAG: hypothetical protein AAFP26_12065, partial [Planctomycetota bacterium]